MKIVKQTSGGIEYLVGVLKQKTKTITKVVFWKIPHKTQEIEDICLKLGRYELVDGWVIETLQNIKPKSELTLDNEEFKNLLEFITTNYEPFRQGVKKYIPIDEKFDKDSIDHLRAIFDNPDKQSVISFVAKNNIFPVDLIFSLQHQSRAKAIYKFEEMLANNQVEQKWQEWFTENSWVLGSEFVKILDEREIDTENIADYLMQAYDGFLDIIEIKRPEPNLDFWASSEDHNNPIPSTDLVKAITQVSKYIFEVEREANSVKFLERVGGVKTIKPRCVLIFGRSKNWTDKQKEGYRLLNSSYHNLSILTYDHVFDRAKRILGLKEKLEETNREILGFDTTDENNEAPF